MKKKKPDTRFGKNNGNRLRKSMCTCGHIGDGPFTAHADTELETGHGKCMIDGCKCKRFKWGEYI